MRHIGFVGLGSTGSPTPKARAALALDPPPQAWFDIRLMHENIRAALQAHGE